MYRRNLAVRVVKFQLTHLDMSRTIRFMVVIVGQSTLFRLEMNVQSNACGMVDGWFDTRDMGFVI